MTTGEFPRGRAAGERRILRFLLGKAICACDSIRYCPQHSAGRICGATLAHERKIVKLPDLFMFPRPVVLGLALVLDCGHEIAGTQAQLFP